MAVACGALTVGAGDRACAAERLLPGEFGDVDLGRPLLEPGRFPTVAELRKAVARPEIGSVLMMKLFGDGANHYLPIWNDDGRKLALQRSDVGAKNSKLLLYPSMSQEKPLLVGDDAPSYDYMFRWARNGADSFVFARLDPRSANTQVFFSADGVNLEIKTPQNGRHLFPTLFQRTDGIWRLVYEQDGQLIHEAWNAEGPVDKALTLARGTSPRWSRDGFHLLMARERRRSGNVAQFEIVVRDLVKENDLLLPLEQTGVVRSPGWAPDESQAACYVRDAGDGKPWRIAVFPVTESGSSRKLGDDVVVNVDFEAEGPAWQPDSRRVWFFSRAHRSQEHYSLVAADVNDGKLTVVDYPHRCTNPNDLALNPATYVPEIAFVAHDGLPQDLFIVFLNHY